MGNIDSIATNLESVASVQNGSALTGNPEKILAGMKSRANKEQMIAGEKFRMAAEWCPTGIVMIDRAGMILLVNAEFERLFQYRRDELIGQPITILIPPRYRAEFPKIHAAYCENPQPLPMGKGGEYYALRKDDKEVAVEIGLNPKPTQDGDMAIVVAITDVSERKRNDQNKDEFVAMVSHELRTPLTSIAASLGLLVADTSSKLSDAAKRLLRIAHGNSQRLVRLINDILDMEKIESGKVEFHMKRVDARALVEQVIESNRAFADEFAVAVRLDPNSIEAFVRADADRLTQVITNLLSNAVKFSPRGGEVLLMIKNVGDNARIAVRDHGPGIPEEFRSRIFDRFAQAATADARQKSGTGLGLSIVKEIAARLGGEAGYEPAVDGGTIFHIDLPHYGVGAEGAEGAHILLCSDDPSAAPQLCDKLHDAGFNVDIVFSAEDAVRDTATRSYAAIVIDLQHPDSNGMSLIKQLRAQWHYQNEPMIAVSIDSNLFQSDKPPLALNALDWLSKPLDIERLTRILNRPIIRDAHRRPRVLHFDGDQNVLRQTADTLKVNCEVFSVESIEQARQTLSEQRIDLAVIELDLSRAEFGLDILSDLHDRNGNPIPIVMYSALDRPDIAARFVSTLTRSRISINGLIAILRSVVAGKPSIARIREVA